MPAPVRACAGASPQKLREIVIAVRKIGVAVAFCIGSVVIGRRIIPIEGALGRPLGACRVDFTGVEPLAFAFIAQQIVGARDFLELFFG